MRLRGVILLLLASLFAWTLFAEESRRSDDLSGNWSVWINDAREEKWHAAVFSSGEYVSIVESPGQGFDWGLQRSGNELRGREADGNGEVTGRLGEGGDTISITSPRGVWKLQRAARRDVTGTVTDARTGRPIRGAFVLEDTGMFSGGSWGEREPAVTDSRGAFSLRKDELDPSPVHVTVRGAGLASIEAYLDRDSPNAPVSLTAAVPITGQIVDERGKPVPGASVSLSSRLEPRLEPKLRQEFSTSFVESGTDGRFIAGDLPAGPYSIDVRARGFLEKHVDFAATKRTSKVTLQPAGRTRVVLRANGQRLTSQTSVDVCTPGIAGWLYVDDKGVIQGDLPLGKVRIVARGASVGAADVTVAIGSEPADVFVDLEPRGTVRGRVVDQLLNAGVSGATVRFEASPWSTDSCTRWFASVVSGDDGHFEVLGLISSSATLSVAQAPKGFVVSQVPEPRNGRSGDAITVRIGTEDVELPVFSGGRIAGRLLEPDGTPSKSGTIHVRPLKYQNRYSSGYSAEIREGRFEVEESVPLLYTYEVEACDGEGRSLPLEVAADTPIELRLLPSATVTGRVVKSGVPHTEAFVSVYYPDGKRCYGAGTDALGRFSVQVAAENAKLGFGSLPLMAECGDGWGGGVFRDVSVKPREVLELGDIEVGCKAR